jgi:membrane protein
MERHPLADLRADKWRPASGRAAGVVFYGLLALFPAITALVSSYALLADAKTVNDHIAFLSDFLPQGTFSIIQDQVGRVLSKGDMKLGGAFLASLLLAIWSANGAVKAIIDASNVAYDEKEKWGFFKPNAVSLGFTMSGVAGILVLNPTVCKAIAMNAKSVIPRRSGRAPSVPLSALGWFSPASASAAISLFRRDRGTRCTRRQR